MILQEEDIAYFKVPLSVTSPFSIKQTNKQQQQKEKKNSFSVYYESSNVSLFQVWARLKCVKALINEKYCVKN